MALGIIGIVLAFAVLIYLTFKGVSTLIITPIAVLVVAIFNGLPVLTSYTETYMGGVANLLLVLFPLIMLGAILGKIYDQSGAALSIANFFDKILVQKLEGEKKIRAAIAVIVIVSNLLVFGGIDSFIIVFTTFPFVVSLCQKAGISKRCLPGLMLTTSAASCCAGSPTVHNVLPMTMLGTTSNAALIPGIIALVIIGGGIILSISHMAVKDYRRGVVADYSYLGIDTSDEREKPHILLAIIPIIVVFVLFSIVGLHVTASITVGIILAVILFAKYIKPTKTLKEALPQLKPFALKATGIRNTLNDGAMAAPLAVLQVAVVGGFATVVATTPAFGALSEGLMGLPIHPLLIVMIGTFILVAITSAPPAGLQIILPMFAAAFLAAGAFEGIVSAGAIHRIAAVSCVTFETLPFNGAVMLVLQMAKQTHKEGYFSLFVTTVFWPIIAAVVVTLLLIAFPGLA